MIEYTYGHKTLNVNLWFNQCVHLGLECKNEVTKVNINLMSLTFVIQDILGRQ